MPTRRSHSNSHHGCMECKRRRVKCDQQQPKCARCVRRNSECTYRHLMTSYNPWQMQQARQPPPPITMPPSLPPTPYGQTSQGFRYVFQTAEDTKLSVRATEEPIIKTEPLSALPSSIPPTPFIKTEETSESETATQPFYSPKPTFSLLSAQVPTGAELEPSAFRNEKVPAKLEGEPAVFRTEQDDFLMHHYTTKLTAPTMSPVLESDIFPYLNGAILQHVETVPYLRHVVLAFSGLHLASISPSNQSATYLHTALAHKDAALGLFKPTIAEGITPQTAEPQLAASAILVACCLALPAADPGRRMNIDRIDILAEVAGLFQGTSHIYQHNAYQGLLRTSPSTSSPSSSEGSSVASYTPRSPGDNVPWTEAMESLQRCIDAMEALPPTAEDLEEERRNVLKHAASSLQKAFVLISEARKGLNILCAWLGMVKHQIVKLINERDPLALVLLAHWAICRTNMDDIWWARAWPAAAVAAIFEALDDTHRPLLSWCLSQARGRVRTGHHQPVEVPVFQFHGA